MGVILREASVGMHLQSKEQTTNLEVAHSTFLWLIGRRRERTIWNPFWTFLGQAAQVVKMDDSGAVLGYFCGKLPKLSKWTI